jgi:hypothetical protein
MADQLGWAPLLRKPAAGHESGHARPLSWREDNVEFRREGIDSGSQL